MKNNKKYRKKRYLDTVWAMIMLLMFCYFPIEGIRSIMVVNNIDNNKVIETTCGFELRRIESVRNVSYKFDLENGETIWVDSELFDNRELIDSFSDLTFTYVGPKGSMRYSYACIEITSTDKRITFVDKSSAIKELKLAPVVYFVIGIPPAILCSILIIFKLILKF